MGHRCCTKLKVKRGLWSPEEDEKLVRHVTTHGHSSWSSVPKLAGLQRCGKSCRLRWINYLRPDLKRGSFTDQEEQVIIDVHRILGNRWAQIAKHLPGRTDNEVKNFWNSSIKKKLISQGLDPKTHNLFPSHQRPSINKVTISQTHQQQPFSPFTLSTTQNILEASMVLNPPFLTLPSPPPNDPMAMATSDECQKNPNLVQSSIESFPISSSSPSSGNPSGFGLLEENYCFWGTDIETVEPPRLLEGLLQPQGQDQEHQLMIMKECNGEVQADKMMDEIKGAAGDQDVDGSIFDNSTFDLVAFVSAAMSSDLTSMDSTLVWNF